MTMLAVRAEAHSVGLSRADYRISGSDVRATYVFSSAELASTFPEVDLDGDGMLSPSEAARGRAIFESAIVRSTFVRADGSACGSTLDGTEVGESDAVEIHASFACDHAPRHLSIDCEFIDRLAGGHHHIASLEDGGRQSSFVVATTRKQFDVDLEAPTRPAMALRSMVWMGVTHILTGYDHLAFLLGLILLGGRVRTLVGVISAFTVAHSITLGLAATRVVSVPGSIVEPAIALSIAYVGLENLVVTTPVKRWRITFPFGLLHGFGFSAALTQLDLPRAQVPPALFAFNLGVELGQLAVLAIALPLVVWARKFEVFRRWGVPALSLSLVAAGCAWFGLRVHG